MKHFNKKTIKKVILTAVVLFSTSATFAQFSIHAGVASPMGAMAESDVEVYNEVNKWILKRTSDQGGAGVGFNVGMQYKLNFPSLKGFGVTLGADFIYNGANRNIRSFKNEMFDELETACIKEGIKNYDYSLTLPQYINVPVLAGINYTYGVNDAFGIFVEGSCGADIRMITDLVEDLNIASYSQTITLEYATSVNFAFQFGVGFMVMDYFSMGGYYSGLGSDNVKINALEKYDDPQNIFNTNTHDSVTAHRRTNRELSTNLWQLRIGYSF